ncbi:MULTISPECIES: alpha-2,8-polysialyltransferase family protein [unclassified Streptomyces]|uniref:alpha-2,8-polysialyltransferase family protein n=1 Tax=unclassified Streptomyces TaxID=2593676 RepID=UPI002250CF80|nr:MULTISPECIES: alpha-2,8-polysialyltransferase family protein [unclassified Streptomyces]MCX5050607.1 alpha-2,8-polysialyltransferase family protein [Streptomyces sp. NBC_00474]MCX5060985.1 alpha-2,8-polysialyltransferase family protein [Streptomyces sp. NBC_00452]MCX5248515.1 alpha-2,8-polysialyltransferase family protein [Streptomyces sp. NBC_00201]MCX5293390.1 alpha-2,8-polysialyltransferase family protein [Streptomyces sp. NBC_00183]
MPRTTRIFCVSTLYGAATLAAALDSDCFKERDGEEPARRLLLVFNNSATPETTPPVDEMPGFEPLRGHFDTVLSWNEAIRPFHPGSWTPRADDIPLFERYLRLLWDLGDDRVELVVESIQVTPALSVAQLFTDAPVDVYADGLMSYGPTRNKLDPLVGTRVRRLLHLDLVPGLTPMLLTEFDVPAQLVPTAAFLKVLGELTASLPELPLLPDNAALLLGQYLSALNILSPDEEEDLHVRMMRGAVERGHRSVVFKPHPTAPARYSRALETEAEKLGIDLVVLDVPVLAEVLFEKSPPGLVVGCFSTALFTASAFYGLPVARIGTEALLDRLTPYQNSNRVPAVLADALIPDLEGGKGEDTVPADTLDGLVNAVGFSMQPQIYPSLRPAAERYLSRHFADRTRRYFKRKRLTSLGLPGGIPERLAFLPRSSTARRVVRRARAIKKAVKR